MKTLAALVVGLGVGLSFEFGGGASASPDAAVNSVPSAPTESTVH